MRYRRSKRNRNKSSPQDTSSPKKHRQSSVDKAEPEIVSQTAALDMGDVEEMQSQSDLTNDSTSLNQTGQTSQTSQTNQTNQNVQPCTEGISSVNGPVSQPQFDSTPLRFINGQPMLDQNMNNNIMQPGTPMQFHPQQMLHFASPIQNSSQMQPQMAQAVQFPHMPSIPLSSGLSDGDVLRIASQLKLLLQDEVEKLVEARVSLALAPLKEELVNLKADVKTLIAKNDDLEQYSRRTCLRISGIRESRNEDVSQIVLNLANRIGAGINPSDIDRTHRVGKLRGTEGAGGANDEIRGSGREIIVKFTNYNARLKFLKGRAILRNENANIFINEDLTKVRKTLAYECRRLKKAKGIKNTWIYDGNIYIEDMRDQRTRISCVDELGIYWASIQRNGGNAARA